MIRKFCFLLFFFCCALATQARSYVVKGCILDGLNDGKPLLAASVRMLKADSTFVTGQTTNRDGLFSITTNKAGKYILELKFVGYLTQWRNVALSDKTDTVKLEKITLKESSVTLGNVTVRAAALKMVQKKDTFVFNAEAFSTPEGATLKKLVEQLPGVVVGDDGKITVNGKSVSEIKINGKDFFKGDTQVAMDNLPVNMVSKVKAYEEKSDYSKRSGVDDGDKKTVLDIKLKRELKSSFTSQGSLGVGTQHRYENRLFGNRFTDLNRQTIFGSMSNLDNDGKQASKNIGTSLQWMNKEKWEEPGRYQIDVNLRYDHQDNENISSGNSETFLAAQDYNSYSNHQESGRNWNSNYNAGTTLFWNVDSLSFLYANVNFSISKSRNHNQNRSATFKGNPYQFADLGDPLDAIYSDQPDERLTDLAINRNDYRSQGHNRTQDFHAAFGFWHRLDTLGQHVYFHSSFNENTHTGHQFNLSQIHYYQAEATQNQTFYNQYVKSPTTSRSAEFEGRYAYPLNKHLIFISGYKFSYSYNDNDRVWYELDSMLQYQADRYPVLGTLPAADSLALAYNAENSQYTTYHEAEHRIEAGLEFRKKDKYYLTAKMYLTPHRTKLDFRKSDFSKSLTRNVCELSPAIYGEYHFTENRILYYNGGGSSSYPSMMSLIDVPDNSNPLYVTHGNDALKHSWNNRLSANYSTYSSKLQQSIAVGGNFSQTFNSIANTITYVPETGGQISRPENINGNWDAGINGQYTRSLGEGNKFQFDANNNTSFNHSVGFVTTGSGASLTNVRNTMKTLHLNQQLGAGFRVTYFDAHAGIGCNYQRSRADRQANADLDVYGMNYSVRASVRTKWHLQCSSQFNIYTRSGYDDPQMNTSQYVWNAQLSQGFLKDEKLSISCEVFDILCSRKNVSHNVWATGKSETHVNTIGCYGMLKLIYKLNLFGGKKG